MTHGAPQLLLVSTTGDCIDLSKHLEDLNSACTAKNTPKSDLLQSGHALQELLFLRPVIVIIHELPELTPIITAYVVPEALALRIIKRVFIIAE